MAEAPDLAAAVERLRDVLRYAPHCPVTAVPDLALLAQAAQANLAEREAARAALQQDAQDIQGLNRIINAQRAQLAQAAQAGGDKDAEIEHWKASLPICTEHQREIAFCGTCLANHARMHGARDRAVATIDAMIAEWEHIEPAVQALREARRRICGE